MGLVEVGPDLSASCLPHTQHFVSSDGLFIKFAACESRDENSDQFRRIARILHGCALSAEVRHFNRLVCRRHGLKNGYASFAYSCCQYRGCMAHESAGIKHLVGWAQGIPKCISLRGRFVLASGASFGFSPPLRGRIDIENPGFPIGRCMVRDTTWVCKERTEKVCPHKILVGNGIVHFLRTKIGPVSSS